MPGELRAYICTGHSEGIQQKLPDLRNCRGVSFGTFALIGPMLTKTDKIKIVKNLKLKISEIQNSTVVRTIEKKLLQKFVEKLKSDLKARGSFF